MKFITFFVLVAINLHANTVMQDIRPLSDTEAAEIVAAQEAAKERAKDAREAQLKSAEIIETAVADLGHRKVIFNRVKAGEKGSSTPTETQLSRAAQTSFLSEGAFFDPNAKETVHLALSGTVYDGVISELWWTYEGQRYACYINANAAYFSGTAEVESETTRYSLLVMLVIEQSTENTSSDKWRPTLADFSPDALEYFIADWGESKEPNMDAFAGIEALLRFYSQNEAQLKTRHDNALKLNNARAEYLKSNPPKVNRDTIINFRPTGKGASKAKK